MATQVPVVIDREATERDTDRELRSEYGEAAVMGCRAVRDFLASNGDDRKLSMLARVGVGAMGSYAKLRGTMANESALRLAAAKAGVPELGPIGDGD